MHAMKDDAHSLPRSNQCRDADEKSNQRNYSPGPASGAEGKNDGNNQTSHNATNTQAACEDDARPVAIANGPTNEVGMRLATQGPFHRRHDLLKGRRVRGALESMQKSAALL